jgi:hypothetical protein
MIIDNPTAFSKEKYYNIRKIKNVFKFKHVYSHSEPAIIAPIAQLG